MERIEEIVKEFFNIIGFNNVEIDIKKDSSLKDKELLKVNVEIDSKQANYFLDENAIGLNAVQHLLRVLISRESPDQIFFVLDINNHRKIREETLAELAIKAAQKARRTKKPVVLDPMPAYERRLIHLKLAEEPDIVTESLGQEPERKTVVRPYP